MRKRLVIIGIGGASCSGKTLLAKHIQRALPSNSILLHQDDFAPPAEQIPASPEYGVADWDDPPTAVLWDNFRSTLHHIKYTGRLPEPFQGHDHLNKQIEVGIDGSMERKWKEEFKRLELELAREEEEIVWVLVDGFILFWDQLVASMLDIRIFLRVPSHLLKERREVRQTYVLQTGDVWTDPPRYFEQIVYPAYVKAHAHLFEAGDVESGETTTEDVAILEPADGEDGMTYAFDRACQIITDNVSSGKGSIL